MFCHREFLEKKYEAIVHVPNIFYFKKIEKIY